MRRRDDRLRALVSGDEINELRLPRTGCPTPEELVYSFKPDASPELKEKIIDHLLQCNSCQREFELVRGYLNLIEKVERRVLRKPSNPIQKIVRLLITGPALLKFAAISLLLLVLASSYFLLLKPDKDRWVERTPSLTESFSLSEEISFSQPATIRLIWKPVDKALFYRVEVFDHQMYMVWQSPSLEETRVELPEEVVSILQASPYFFWHLIIYTSESHRLESPARKAWLNPQ